MNQKVFELYKNTPDYKKAVDIFNPNINDVYEGIKLIKTFESEKFGTANGTDYSIESFNLYFINFSGSPLLPREDNVTRDVYEKFINDYELFNYYIDDKNKAVLDTSKPLVRKDKFRMKAVETSTLSLYLYYRYSFFKPVLLQTRFDIFQRNCYLLGIDLPTPPRKRGYFDNCMYYYDICESINKFQQDNNLSDAELCACIYDFANILADNSNISQMPSPTNVWLTGGSGDDFRYLDSLGKDKSENRRGVWACNERTRRGDIIIMYCLSPRSYIHSIWRASSSGIFNPFDNYQCRTTLCDGIRIPNISFKELKSDRYFRDVPIVRKNLQGINGWELTANDYNELLRMIKERGGDISSLPKLFNGGDVDFGEIKLEKDVEEKILIPALKDLGYQESDWTRQLELKAGRKEKAIPDFVFFAKGLKHFESAPMVIEAKLDMSSMTEMQKAFRQALSYARMLRSRIMGICDQERIIIYNVDEYGSANISKPLFENHWKAIFTDAVIGGNLKHVIGPEVVRKKD